MRTLLGAIQFLTIVPVKMRTVEPWRAAVFFPLVGAALGAGGALMLGATADYLPIQLRALLVVLFWVAVTGGLHEDGLADVADGCRAERPREKILEIMKDSRIGTYGGLALLMSVLFRWQGLAGLTMDPWPALVAVMALSRAAIVVLARISAAATDGMGSLFTRNVSGVVAALAAAQGAAAAFWCGWPLALILVAATGLVVLGARWYFHRRIGGVTGDCLGAASQIVEMILLGVLACQSSIW